MGFQPPVPQQDTNWEIRAAVLASLVIQVFLIFVAPLRRRSASRFPRFVVWSCYLLADWVADLCLGLLLNSLGNIGAPAPSATVSLAPPKFTPAATPNSGGSGTSSPVIFAFWAPFLLLHLGGPDTITAFSVEDNELWLRHLIGLLFELSAAAVVFFCSLRGNPFIVASVFMFIVGIVKYAERTYCLYRGSADGLRSSMLGDPDPGSNYAMIMGEYDAKRKAGLTAEIDVTKAPDAASADATIGPKLDKSHPVESTAFQLYQTFQCLFADLILSFNERKVSQEFFERLDAGKAFELIEVELGFVYDIIYTKAAVVHTRVGYALRLIGSACIVTALLIFFFVDKRGFTRLDVVITYALLAGAAVLDIAAFVMLLCSDRARVFFADNPLFNENCECIKNSSSRRRRRQRLQQLLQRLQQLREQLQQLRQQLQQQRQLQQQQLLQLEQQLRLQQQLQLEQQLLLQQLQRRQQQLQRRQQLQRQQLQQRQEQQRRRWRRRRWSEKVSRLSLIRYCLDEPVRAWLPSVSRLASWLADKLRVKEFLDETLYVRRKKVSEDLEKFVFEKLKEMASEAKDYAKINEVCERRGAGALKKLELPNEQEQELMKYVEVDFDESLLLWHIATELCQRQTEPTDQETKQQRISMEVSEYLVYLLVMRPAMLSTAAGIGLLRYRDTCAEARRFFRMVEMGRNGNQKCSRLASVNTEKKPVDVKGDRSKSVLFDACILSKQLNKLEKSIKWKVVSEVWAEMLVYAACHCGAAGHARQLGRGGEFATVVWLLLAHVGLGQLYQIQSGDARAKLIVQK